MHKKFLLLLSFIFLFAFAVFSKFEDREVLRNLDFSATVRVQDAVAKVCTSRCDGLIEDIGFFASPLFSVVAVGVLMFLYRKRGWRVLAIPMLFGLLTLAEIYGKSIVRHPSPPFFMLKNPTTIFPTYHVIEQFSYPSGHTARAVFLALLLWKKNIWVMVGLAAYIGVIALGKIYLGQHWLSDVAGGLLLGAGFSLPIWLLTGKNMSPIMRKQ